MRSLRKFLVAVVAMGISCVSVAQTGSVAATAELVPVSNITKLSASSPNAPIETLQVLPSAVGGAWVNSAVGPTIYQKGTWFMLNLNPVGSVPASATITSVVYNWSVSYKPTGLIVYLCHNDTTACANVTSPQSASTIAFNNRTANKKMIFAFYVPGTGSLFPNVLGKTDQVIVNYQY